MLPPVNASVATQPLTTPAIGQREARPDGPAAIAQGQGAAQQVADAAASRGTASETLASLRQLADLLASRQVDAEDILTRLAIDFAAALGEAPLPEEASRAFSSRLAGLIRQLPASTLLAARQASNLGALNISLQAFATALADPASPAAARLVAMAEDPGADGLEHTLKAAIDSYEQNGETAPARPSLAPAAAQTTSTPPAGEGPAGSDDAAAIAKVVIAVAEAEDEPGAETPLPPRAALASPHDQQTEPLQRQTTPPSAPVASSRPEAAATASSTRQAASQPPVASLRDAEPDRSEGQPTMQVLRGFNVVVANIATRAADVLKTVAALAEQAEAAQTFAPAGAAVAEEAAKPVLTGTPTKSPAAPEVAPDPTPVIAGKAHEAARAMEGKVIPLFSRPATPEDVENIDIDRLIRMAQQTAAKVDPARVPEQMLAAQTRLPEPVPFAQVPYPFVREEEEKHRRRGFGEQAGSDEDGEEMTGEDGQSLWHGDGEQAERREEPEIEEHPFDAEEPLKRNPTDAERALHMYQRFGGF